MMHWRNGILKKTDQAVKHERIFLVGFMGSGKTTMGKKLAAHLGYVFNDLDKLIEADTGLTVAAYFKEHGEEAFRLLERDKLQHSNWQTGLVLSTGGGTPCFFDNMDWMNRNGATVYLHMTAQALAERLEQSKRHKRPLISHLYGADLLNFVEERLASREIFYRQAKYTIEMRADMEPLEFLQHAGL